MARFAQMLLNGGAFEGRSTVSREAVGLFTGRTRALFSPWTRRMTWAGTGGPWVPPSPNLRSAEAAMAYPGTALLEATNVTEGRGTEAPFRLLGTPRLLEDLRSGRTVEEILAADATAHAAWRRDRLPALLYR